MTSRFEQFIKERTYLKNVSPRTAEWHEQSLKWLKTEEPTEDELKACVMRMREAGECGCMCEANGSLIRAGHARSSPVAPHAQSADGWIEPGPVFAR